MTKAALSQFNAADPFFEYGKVVDIHPVYTAMALAKQVAVTNGTEPAEVAWDPEWPDLDIGNEDSYWTDLVERNWELLARWHAIALKAEGKVIHLKMQNGVESFTIVDPDPVEPAHVRIAQPGELTKLRIQLHDNGYDPVPIVGAHINTRSAGKRPCMAGWQTKCRDADLEEIMSWSTSPDQSGRDTNTGILCGDIIGVDIDVLDDVLSAKLTARAMEVFGRTPLRRIGRAPKMLLCYRVNVPHPKLTTPELIFGDAVDDKDAKAKLEVLADGQQFVAFGIHPDTGAYYHWPDKSPLDVAASAVPLVTLELLQQFVAESEQLLREAGGRTKAEIEAAKPAALSISQRALSLVKPPVGTILATFAKTSTGEETFFKKVNALAMSSLSSWVPALFPTAKLQPGTGAWRVSSKDLGRDLEEDLSISPMGIRDWGLGDQGDARDGKRTSIDLVIEYKQTADSIYGTNAAEAALWLCQQIGIAPETLGWNNRKQASSTTDNVIQLPGIKPKPASIPLVYFDEVEGFVQKNWLIKGVIAKGETSMWIAPPGKLKSALMTDLASPPRLWHGLARLSIESNVRRSLLCA
jgi:hypothetical protein